MSARIGLVLGAGGVAGGAFHSGVLAAIHDSIGWDARRATVMVGTSAGSIAATSLRAGLAPADMLARSEGKRMSSDGRRILSTIGFPPPSAPLRIAPTSRRPAQLAATLAHAAARPLSAPPWALLAGLLPEGAVSTDFIAEAMGGLFPDGWPTEPLLICAVRQSDGHRVVFGRDGLRPAVRDVVAASCAIPGFFSPVTIDGEAYVDGGLHSPTNADVLGSDDADLVVVSSPMSLTGRQPRLSATNAVRRWSGALLNTEALRLRRRGVKVVAFQPTADDAAIMGSNAMDPTRRGAIARAAYESTLRRLDRADTRERLALLTDG